MGNLARRVTGRKILMDLEHELRVLDQVIFITDGYNLTVKKVKPA